MTQRDRRAIFLGAGALATIASIWLLIIPWLTSWSATRQRIDHSHEQLQELERQAERLVAVERQLEPVFGASVKRPLNHVSECRTRLIKELIDLYARAGAQIRSVQPESDRPVREVAGVLRLTVQVQTTCPPLQFVQLLAATRSGPSLLLIDRVETAAAPQGPGAMNVTIVWSTLAEQETAP